MPDLATYNLRDQQGYLIFSTHDLGEAVEAYDGKRDVKPHFDDFGITELRERLTEQRKAEKAAEKKAKK